MNTESVFAQLIQQELQRRHYSVGEFAELCRLPDSRLQQILTGTLMPTIAELSLIAPYLAKDEAGQTFWTETELADLLPV